MSGRSKQGVCVTTAILYSWWLSKAIVSAKQATCTPPQKEVRSQVRCLLILGSSTQKLFNNNSVNIPLQDRYALFSSLIKTHGVKLNQNSPALFWKLVMKLVRNSSS